MKFKKIGPKYFVRLEKGEEIISKLTKLCQAEKINFGTILAIGGATHVTLGWYELSTKNYHWQDFSGHLEVVSFTGNVALLEDKSFLHIHCVVSNETFACFGGHLKEGLVAGTLEAVIEKFDQPVERIMDDETGLNILALESN